MWLTALYTSIEFHTTAEVHQRHSRYNILNPDFTWTRKRIRQERIRGKCMAMDALEVVIGIHIGFIDQLVEILRLEAHFSEAHSK